MVLSREQATRLFALIAHTADENNPASPNAYSTRTNGTNIPTIPSLPISWANAQFLLKEIEEGGLNWTISLVNNVDDKVMPIWNVLGVIPGHIKDEVVVVGNHRDAWVMGAVDPSSGTSSVHEVVRGLGTLLRHGWTPLRTIVIASWDAEEYGLIVGFFLVSAELMRKNNAPVTSAFSRVSRSGTSSSITTTSASRSSPSDCRVSGSPASLS
ncbi:hypothetical protein V8D89_012128 [Ganoderma adspersum]